MWKKGRKRKNHYCRRGDKPLHEPVIDSSTRLFWRSNVFNSCRTGYYDTLREKQWRLWKGKNACTCWLEKTDSWHIYDYYCLFDEWFKVETDYSCYSPNNTRHRNISGLSCLIKRQMDDQLLKKTIEEIKRTTLTATG